MLIGVIEAEQAERDQHADYARIDDAIRLAEQNIAALESRQLEPHETRKKLLDYLNYLIRVGDVGRVQCIRVVFKARGDHHRYDLTFEKMLAQFALAEFGGLEERLTRICRLADEVDAALAAIFAAHISTNRLQQLAVCIDYPARQTQDNLAA